MSGARNTDPSTSHEAMKDLDTTALEKQVLRAMQAGPPEGMILDEIVQACPNLRPWTVSPRLKPLQMQGLIRDTGKRRKGGAERNQRVLQAVEPEKVRTEMINFLLELAAKKKLQLEIVVQ